MSFSFLRMVSEQFLDALCALPELELARADVKVHLPDDAAERMLSAVPYGIGTEYITRDWLENIFHALNDIFSLEISAYDGTVAMFLAEKSQRLRVPERVFFHLVENTDDTAPFAFLATYATTDKKNRIRHMPLQYALTEYQNSRENLVALLSCLNRAAEDSAFVGNLMESGEMFHPLRLTTEEAYSFLKDIPLIEAAGILCRVPNWWKKRAAAISMQVTLGDKKPSLFGFDALVEMQPRLTVGGKALTEAEIERLLSEREGLRMLKGRWVEVNHALLRQMLARMEAYDTEITLMEALRMGSGISEYDADVGPIVTNGKWLTGLMQRMRNPGGGKPAKVPSSIRATLRPYQKTGYSWLKNMQEGGFGACLADDMGLGKTLQVLTWLENLRKSKKNARVLLIVPASLLGNWEKEAERFAPNLPFSILHGRGHDEMEKELKKRPVFLTITTYGMAVRLKNLADKPWTSVILDEAQAIKNPVSKQTRAIKKLRSETRIAMTGTPIENNLTNLWSLFDFLNKGLLGSSEEFRSFVKRLEDRPEGYARLKAMVSPFILRRLKTDRTIISDLPDKIEQVDYVQLSKQQIALYRKTVKDMEHVIKNVEGIERRGMILGYITRLKQICNHPDQYTGQKTYAPEESGKFALLEELCETIREKHERVLVFTQYREITDYLADFLKGIFGTGGHIIHGGVPARSRTKLVDAFNDPEEYVPYMVLSVKAAGVGLNLTGANHVIHFDRWWNPAVENQATDRAFRIGQGKNVFVHKMVSRGTIEEKIDALINSKKELAENVIGSGGEQWITEMSDAELMNLLRLEV
ncbi:MAG: DEAD/DEAH box helicase [Lachnospiraceae bacterium]|nr:DEAD/DEAH box helicase [Lachnospiraceae bacterium]